MESNKRVEFLKKKFDDARTQYNRDHRRIKMLQDADGGDLWRTINGSFPAYQILTDSNWISYVKSNLTASLYTVSKSADIIPTSEHDKSICLLLSVALEHIWDTQKVGYYEFQAGDNAALCNLGLTQVVWDQKKNVIKLENINPLEFMRDPYANNLEEAGWCCRYGTYHKSVLLNNPKYKEATEAYLRKNQGGSTTIDAPQVSWKPHAGASRDHLMVSTFWVREKDGSISETTLVDLKEIVYENKAIKPNCFPIAELYCNVPNTRLVGISEPAKIFANNVAYNLMTSNIFTAEYKNQRPPKFISAASGLNLADFAKHGDQADRTFIVNGSVRDAVFYHEFPKPSPNLTNSLKTISMDMQEITGVDGRYTGRDTGSIITTGGTQEMLNRVSMIDAPKVMNYEDYVSRLTKIIIEFMFAFSPKRTYLKSKPGTPENPEGEIEMIQVDFPTLSASFNAEDFDYTVQISSELPKNKQRAQAWADRMMEKQMQYRQNGDTSVTLITEEEWLELQSDVPNKERMLERMGVERSLNLIIEASEAIRSFSDALEAGISEDEALMQSAQALGNLRNPGAPPQEAPQGIDPMAALSEEPVLTEE